MNILICSAGKRVSLVRAFKLELEKHDSSGKIFTTDFNPDLSPACQVSDGCFKVCKVTEPDYINELLTICITNQITIVIPTIDTELQVLSIHKSLFLSHNINIIISDSDFIFECRDKRLTNAFFTKTSINIPKTIDKDQPTFPFFIKPYDGSLSKDIFLINSITDLTAYHLSNEKLMFMEYINPIENHEYTVDMYYGRDHYVKCIIPRRRIEVRAGEISKGLTVKDEIVTFLKERLNKIEGAIGCLTVQLFYNKKTKEIKGIEINARFGGGYPLSYLAGGNFPGYIIDEYISGNSLSYHDDWEENLLMLRYDDEVIVHGYRD